MKVVYPTRAASVPMPGGYTVYVPLGTHWADSDPVVLQHPGMFSDDPRYGLYGNPPRDADGEVVEQASAAPGEKRIMKRG